MFLLLGLTKLSEGVVNVEFRFPDMTVVNLPMRFVQAPDRFVEVGMAIVTLRSSAAALVRCRWRAGLEGS